MGAPLDQFIFILFRGLSDQLLCLLYGAPSDHLFAYYYYMYMGFSQISFFVYYIGAPSDQFFHLLYGPPPPRLVSVLTIWGTLRSVFVDTTCIWGPPQVSFFAYYRGPPQISFFAYYMGPRSSQFLRLLYGGLLMPVSSLTMWAPSDQFLSLL